MNAIPSFKEDHISQIPALQLLQRLGWTYLSPEQALALRGGRPARVILHAVLEEQLRKMNRIQFKGQTYAFSEGNIQTAIQARKNFRSTAWCEPTSVSTTCSVSARACHK